MKPESREPYSTIGTGLVISILILSGCATSGKKTVTCQPTVKKAIFDELTVEERKQTGKTAVLVVFSEYDTHVSGAFRSDKGYSDATPVSDGLKAGVGASMGVTMVASLAYTLPYVVVPVAAGAVVLPPPQEYSNNYTPRDRVKILKKSAYHVLHNYNADYELLRIVSKAPELQPQNGIELLARVPGVDAEAKMLLREAINQHDTYLEITLEEIKIHSGWHSEETRWCNSVDVHINVRARMIRVSDKAVLSDNLYVARNMVVQSSPLKALLANQADLLNRKILLGMQQNTAAIADDFLKQNREATSGSKQALATTNNRL